MPTYDILFSPLKIKHITIKNRFLSTSHCPAYAHNGEITDRYVLYEQEKAKGGVGLLQFGGATTVSVENSFHYGQINGAIDAVVPQYRRMASAIHRYGARCMVQLTHGGRRERWDAANWLPAFAPSLSRELIHGSFAAAMEDHDVRRICQDFGHAARRTRDGDIDGVEISCQAGTLVEQFWSPLTNHRSDAYGGSLQNRMRFGLEVLETVRSQVGDDYVVGIRMPGDEMLKGGLTPTDCIAIAQTYASSGLIDFISVVGGVAVDYLSTARIWPTMWVPTAPYLSLAGAIREVANIPIFHATRINDAATAAHAVEGGYVDMVGMTRAFIADPHYVSKLESGEEQAIRPCVGAGYCVDRVISGHDALCIHNVATSREQLFSHQIEPTSGARKKVVVVGAGPAGLEAARIAACRGHDVTLLEASSEVGGQVLLAAKAPWRSALSGIIDWLRDQVVSLGVDLRYNTFAERDDVQALQPDVAIIATGGIPNVGNFVGSEHADTVWDVLAGHSSCGKEMLIVDEEGGHNALSCAQFAAKRGAKVKLITPDRVLGTELAESNYGAHMFELYANGVNILPDTRLAELRIDGNRLCATLENVYTNKTTQYRVDTVVGEHGTRTNDELYFALKPYAKNLGESDLLAMVNAEPQQKISNPQGSYFLFRIGDAWVSRNIHAAMLDAMRLCSRV